MEVYAVDITTFTSSFRYPMTISGIQPTLEVPPLSTILGMINAAAGRYLPYTKCSLGYYFEYAGKAIDIETIYMAEVNKAGRLLSSTRSNVLKREFLFDTHLRLYLLEKYQADFFKQPVFPLLLGRSEDLATVTAVEKRWLQPVSNADKIRGQIIPFEQGQLPGKIHALPQYFTNTIPRQVLGKRPYSVLNCRSSVNSSLLAYRDEILDQEVDIFFHELDMETA